uniref:Mitochondrial coenzyme A transporter SLC25A42-like n=1 Tax=Hirondellea gigas TaxID=1518452 RepID=A0A2P2I5H9_9CRUS
MSQGLESSGSVISDLTPNAQQSQVSFVAPVSSSPNTPARCSSSSSPDSWISEPSASSYSHEDEGIVTVLQSNEEKDKNHAVQQQERRGTSVLVSLFSGAMAGAVAKSIIAPLDRTKISFQTTNKRYSNKEAWLFLSNCYKNEGFLSLWRGNSATMARIIPYAAIQFTAHEQWKKVLGLNESTEHPTYKRFVAGSLAGVTSQFLTYPLDLARARMAVTSPDTYRTISQVFIKIVKSDGFFTLYRGLTPTMVGVIPYAGTSFGIYETLKAHHRSNQLKISSEPPVEPSSLERMLFGATAGLFGQSSSYPLDIVRRRMQTATLTGNSSAYSTIFSTITKVYREEGIVHGLYKGLSLNWLKGPISVGTSFAVFDYLKNMLDRRF